MKNYESAKKETIDVLNKKKIGAKINVKSEGREFTFTKVSEDVYTDDFIRDGKQVLYGDYRDTESMASLILWDSMKEYLD